MAIYGITSTDFLATAWDEPFDHCDFAQANIANVCTQRQGMIPGIPRIVPVSASATKLTGRSC